MNRKGYILAHFKSVYELPEKVVQDLEKDFPDKVSWPDKGEEFFAGEKPFELDAVKQEWLGQVIPLPFCEGGNVITLENGKSKLNFDIISGAFMLLSGWQEFKQSKLGSRVSVKDTWQYRYKVIRKPVVNYYFDILKTALEQVWGIEIPLKRNRPSVFLSHPIQHVRSGWKSNIRSELGTYNIGNVFYLFFKRMFGKDIWHNLDDILDMELEYDVRSTFFFMSRKGKGYADYNLRDKPYNGWVKEVQGHGFEAGLLSSNGSHNSAHKLGSDIKKFKYKVYANTFQNYRFKVKQSARSIEKNKLDYDASLGLYDEVGFRNGYCMPFVGWNFEENRPNKFMSIPINLVDGAMIKRKFLSVVSKDVVNLFDKIAEQSALFNGVTSISWSNENFSEFENLEWKRVFEKTIKSGINQGQSFKTGYQLFLEYRDYGLDFKSVKQD